MLFRTAQILLAGTTSIMLLAHTSAFADEHPSDIESGRYRVDPSSTVVQGTPRVIGLAGAYVGIAEGIHGERYNAASAAHRTLDSMEYVDTNFGASVSLPAWIPGSNYFNRSSVNGSESLSILSFGVNVQVGHWGTGLSAEAQQYRLDNQDEAGFSARKLRGNFGSLSLNVARASADRNWIIGAGPVLSGVSFRKDGSSLFGASGVGGQAGILLKPTRYPLRLGVNFRTPVYQMSGLQSSPNQVYQPWQFSFGGAWQFGPAVLNPMWIDPRLLRRKLLREKGLTEDTASKEQLEETKEEVRKSLRERRARLERFGVLISLQFDLLGPSRGTVNVVSVSEQRAQRIRTNSVLSPRLGVESQLVPGRWTIRAGSYLEPSRVELRKPRVHGTTGFDVKLFEWGVFGLFPRSTGWRLSLAVDGAREFFNSSIGLGTWH